jgi:hypothetical protein
MSYRDTYRDTLFYALAIAGGKRELARGLKAPVRQVEKWLTGADLVPEPVFQAALDMVIGSTPQAIFRSRSFLSRTSRPS